MVTTSQTDELLEPCEAFSRIFDRLKIPEYDEYLTEWWKILRALNPSNFSDYHEQVDADLKTMLRPKEEFTEHPFICIFLAHWYNLGYLAGEQKYQEKVERFVLAAIDRFKDGLYDYGDQLNRYNQAISNWYHGLYCYYDSVYDREIYRPPMIVAFEIISDLLNDYRGIKPSDEFYEELKEILDALMPWCEQPRPQEFEDFSEVSSSSDFMVWRKKHESRHARNASSEIDKTPIIRRNFKVKEIAIDTGIKWNLDSQGQKSKLARNKPSAVPKGNSSNTNHKIISGNSIVSRENIVTKGINNLVIPTGYMTPSFPIYGYATAGLKGEAILPNTSDLECASGVDEAGRVIIQEREYEVYSVKGNDHKITPRKDYNFGWLCVNGNSMNCTTPVPIVDQDYVLFYEKHDLLSCISKIVVASQAEFDAQPPRLMVKRLVQKEEIFYLQSESLMKSYRYIEIVKEDQIVGEVVAVAKPI